MVGCSEVFCYAGQLEFFYDQGPNSMKSISSAISLVTIALGNYLNSLMLTVIEHIMSNAKSTGWIPDDLNKGHLDEFFWLLTGICFVNFVAYLCCASRYMYRKSDRGIVEKISPTIEWFDELNSRILKRGPALCEFQPLSYVVSFFSWMPEALKKNQTEIIEHAGLDSAIYLGSTFLGLFQIIVLTGFDRIHWFKQFLFSKNELKIFVPLTVSALLVIIPVNVSGGTLLSLKKDVFFNDIDKLSISNISDGSERFWVHLVMAYLFTIWTCYILYMEYCNVAFMRLHFLATQHRRVEQFAVVVRNIPSISGHSITESVDHFFQKNHPEHYISHQAVYNANGFAKLVRQKERLQNWLDYYQLKFERNPAKKPTGKTGFLGLCGQTTDLIDYYSQRIGILNKRIDSERQRIIKDPKAILPVAFVTFNSRWGAAVCAQTQQSKNPTQWLTEWAPEPRDILEEFGHTICLTQH
ncbi:hypothetical protein HPP92_003339 [Vanilla planifolia]|uniref:Uncharacterized protein n=1 Tax=Vanilla planifolia TaxID=51239 RepID=A0A835S791_VANPL|nr:hypothetical protein HPP92_003339 [Vanilla planifolia]